MNQSEGDDSQTKRTSSPELNEKQSQISEQLENPQFSVQEPLSEYKTEYILIENKITNESETFECIQKIKWKLEQWKENKLTSEHVLYLLDTFIPKVVKTLLKKRFLSDSIGNEVNEFFKIILDVFIICLPRYYSGLYSLFAIFFDNDQYFYLNKGPKPDFESYQEIYASFPNTNKWGSYYIVDSINYFGNKGGFQAIFSQLKNGNPKCPMNLLGFILEGFYQLSHYNYYLFGKLQSDSNQLNEIIVPYLLNLSNEELRNVKKDDYETIIKFLGKLLETTAGYMASGESMEKLQLNVALKCFKCPFFEKRIYGLNYMNEIIGMVYHHSDIRERRDVDHGPNTGALVVYGASQSFRSVHWIDSGWLSKWIQENQIIESLFGKSAQPQLLKRSGDIVSLLAHSNALTIEQLDLIWQCATTVHEVFNSVVLQMLGDVCSELQNEHISRIISHLQNIPPKQFASTYLGLVKDLCKYCNDIEYKMIMIQKLWDLMTDDSPNGPPIEICIQAFTHLQDCVKYFFFRSYRSQWIQKILDYYNQGKSVSFCCDLLITILSTYSLVKNKNYGEESSFYVIQKLQKEQRIIDLFFKELSEFKKTSNQIARQMKNVDFNTIVLGGRLDYITEIKTRLKFLNFILNYCEDVLPSRYYEQLLDNLLVHALTEREKDECFNWLLEGLNEMGECFPAIDEDNATQLFERRLLHLDIPPLSLNAFRCFQQYFLLSNNKYKRIVYQDASRGDDFEIQDANLIGYSYLWEIVLCNNSEDVVRESMEFLIKLRGRFSRVIIDRFGKTKIVHDFIRLCMNHIDDALTDYNSNTLSSEQRIFRCLQLIENYCIQFETETNLALKSHGTSTRGHPIVLIFTNNIPNTTPETIQLETHSNETLADVKQKLKPLLNNFQGLLVNIYFTRPKEEEKIEEQKTLQDLLITNNERLILHATPQVSNDKTTFNRARNRQKKAGIVNNSEPPSDANQKASQISEMFGINQAAAMIALRRGEWDLSATVMFLTEESQKNEIIAEASLLEESNQKRVGNLDDQEVKILPSYILASTETYFNQLFDLLDLNNSKISNQVWKMLLTIPTSQSMFQKLTFLQLDWKELIDAHSNFKLLYSLQIIDSILFPMNENMDVSNRVSWCKLFLQKKGLQYLIQILLNGNWFRPAKQNVTENNNNSTNNNNYIKKENSSLDVDDISIEGVSTQQKNALGLILKVLDFFFHLMISSSSSSSSEEETSVNVGTKEFPILVKEHCKDLLNSLISQLDFSVLVNKLMVTMWDSAKQVAPDRDDQVFVSYSVRLIMLFIVFDPLNLLPKFFDFPNFEKFTLCLLLECPETGIRTAFGGAILQLCSNISGAEKNSNPRNFFLTFLLNHLPHYLETNPKLWAQCLQYFELLEKLIELSCDTGIHVSNFDNILNDFCVGIKSRPIVETRTSSSVDDLLTGMLSIVRLLVKNSVNPSLRLILGQKEGLIQELYYNCLFGLKSSGIITIGNNHLNIPKCKQKRSRVAAFNLLIELCKDCTENFLQLLEYLAKHHVGGLRLSTWEYHPGADDKPSNGYVGLKNLGNTCYINSLIQQLFMVNQLRYDILTVPQEDKTEDNLVYQLQVIFAHLQASEKQSYAPYGFCNAYKDWDGRPTNVHQQQDVDEFFNLLCQRLETKLKKSGNENLLKNIFVGQISNEIRSVETEYPYVTESVEDFNTISLDVKGKSHIHEALHAYVKADRLEGDNAYYCDKYDKKLDATKRCYIKKLSDVLILHLKRFEFDFTTYKKAKVNDYVEFPEYLNMKPWTKEGIMLKEGLEIEPENQHPDSFYEYELMGVLVHSGNTEAGHYYSYIRERLPSQGYSERRWFEFNDHEVSPFDPKKLPAECFGGTQEVKHWDNWQRAFVKRTYDRVRSAYMLVYERVKPLTILHKLPTQIQNSNDFIYGLPIHLYNLVLEENAKFLRDRQLFDHSYFEFMLNFSKLCNFSNSLSAYSVDFRSLENDPNFVNLKLSAYFVIETLTHSKEASNFPEWVQHLKTLFSRYIPGCKWFLLYLIENNLVKELLLECPNEKIRIGIADLLGTILKILTPYEYDFWEDVEIVEKPTKEGGSETIKQLKPISLRFMDAVLSLLEESRNHWRKFKQYFLVIRDFALLGYRERNYLFSRNIIFLYADYFMGKPKRGQTRRVSVMDHFNLPDLTEFIATISILTRGCRNGAPLDKGYPPTTIQQGLVPTMPKKEKKQLLDKLFFSNLLEMDYNPEAAIEIMYHLSWENMKKSKFVLDVILSEINQGWNNEKIPVFFNLLLHILKLKDSFQNTRIIISLSPFSTGNSSCKGLLGLIRECHTSFPRYVADLIRFLLKLAYADEAITSYLQKQKREIQWIEQYLSSKLESSLNDINSNDHSHPPHHSHSLSDGEIIVHHNEEMGPHLPGAHPNLAEPKSKPSTPPPHSGGIPNGNASFENSETEMLQTLHNDIKDLLNHFGGADQEPNYDKERELMEEISELKRENEKLKEALEYFRKHASPDLPIPSFMLEPKWERQQEQLAQGVERLEKQLQNPNSKNNDDNAMELETLSPFMPNSDPNSDLLEKAKQLTAIFTNISVAAAMIALKKTDYDMDNAAFLITDEYSLNEIMKEVAIQESQQVSLSSPQKSTPESKHPNSPNEVKKQQKMEVESDEDQSRDINSDKANSTLNELD